MSSKIGVIDIGDSAATELATAVSISDGSLVELKNLGPNTAWLTETFAADSTYDPGGTNAWPLAPGERVTVRLPDYPVTANTRVPGLITAAGAARVAYIAKGA